MDGGRLSNDLSGVMPTNDFLNPDTNLLPRLSREVSFYAASFFFSWVLNKLERIEILSTVDSEYLGFWGIGGMVWILGSCNCCVSKMEAGFEVGPLFEISFGGGIFELKIEPARGLKSKLDFCGQEGESSPTPSQYSPDS
jgi:hypothetical protein